MLLPLALLTSGLPRPGLCQEGTGWEATVREAVELARGHRYPRVVELLKPVAAREDLPERGRFEVEAELGRALFHMGRYGEAWDHLVEAARIQPRRIEVGLYLEAAAWVTGRRKEALAIFDGILASGARDLYLAVTLPGERGFLADPEVWRIFDRHRRPLQVDLVRGTLAGARLGGTRSEVAEVLGMEAPDSPDSVLTARAGPMILWVLHFDGDGILDDIIIDASHVDRYTSYGLETVQGPGPRSTAAEALVALGSPASTTPTPDGAMVLRWDFPQVAASLEFGMPDRPPPPGVDGGHAVLRMIRLQRR